MDCKMEKQTSYSVLMSVYHREKAEYFEESIDSMLNQTIPPTDFVIMCDGPLTDELDEVIERKVRENGEIFQIVRLPSCGGLGNALAEGIGHCRNELVARMDSDDISVKNRCEEQLKVFNKKDPAIVGGWITEFEGTVSNQKNQRRVPETSGEIREFAKRRNPFNHPSVMFQKEAVLKAGNYQDCKGFEDYYLWVRMLKQGAEAYNIQKVLVYMRTDAGMYERRGSLGYACQAWKARWKIHKMGYSGLGDFLISAGGQVLVSIVPLKLRTEIYKKILRKKL